MTACIQDPACNYNDTEFQQKCDVFVSIQAIAGKPMLNLLARCLSNEQQIFLKKNLQKGIRIQS